MWEVEREAEELKVISWLLIWRIGLIRMSLIEYARKGGFRQT